MISLYLSNRTRASSVVQRSIKIERMLSLTQNSKFKFAIILYQGQRNYRMDWDNTFYTSLTHSCISHISYPGYSIFKKLYIHLLYRTYSNNKNCIFFQSFIYCSIYLFKESLLVFLAVLLSLKYSNMVHLFNLQQILCKSIFSYLTLKSQHRTKLLLFWSLVSPQIVQLQTVIYESDMVFFLKASFTPYTPGSATQNCHLRYENT